MCGICGWLAPTGTPPELEVLERMANTLIHRGPDEAGYHRDGPVGLAIRRLSIIDVACGHQPYRSEDGRITAVFNGEIYNFQEIRERLEARGHRFASGADGEVLVHLYEEHGPDMVHPLIGMFAFALWDAAERTLLLARDRLGIKPLFYATHGGLFYFGSEPKSILGAPGVPRELDPVALDQYLTFEYVPAPRSIYAGIRKLQPGCLLIHRDGQAEIRRYWRLRLNPLQAADDREMVEEFSRRLKLSVERRMISDVPLGAFLSGGIDSSSLVAFMSELAPGRVKTFSIGFREKSYDESRYFREVAAYLGTDHHEEILEPLGAEELLRSLLEVLDEPLGDAAVVPTYLLSRFARKHVTVALAGEGADELLAGYPTYLAHRLAGCFERLPRGVLGALRQAVHLLPVSTRYISLDYKLKRFFDGLGAEPARRHFLWTGSFSPQAKRELYSPELAERLSGHSTFEVLEPHRSELDRLGMLEKIQHLDLHFYLPDDLLVKLDRATMATSLEGRVPFLDHELVEFAARLPSRLKNRGLGVKLALKRAMSGKLPESVLKRAKKGFGIPVADWVKGDLRALLRECLDPARLRREGLFRVEGVERLLLEHSSQKFDHRKQIWTLLIFQLWRQRYLGG